MNSYQQLQQPKKSMHCDKSLLPPQLEIYDAGTTTRVFQNDIDWIDAAGDYMCIHENGKTHIMRSTMKSLEAKLDTRILQRIHRSTIINIHEIQHLLKHINGEYFLTLNCGEVLKMSRSYKHKLEALVAKQKLEKTQVK